VRWLWWLAWRQVWSWRGRSLLSLLALALGVGLLVATGSIGALMQASLSVPAPLDGRPADLWIASAYDADYDVPAGLALRLAEVSGVAEVQPVLRRPVRVRTPRPDNLALLGVDPAAYFAFHGLELAAGELPTREAPGVVALAPWAFVRELTLGQPISVTTPTRDVALPVVGLIEVDSLASARHGPALYAPLETVADMFAARDAATTLEVRLAPGAPIRRVRSAVEAALGPAYAVSSAAGPGQDLQLWQRLILGALACVDALALLGCASLVYAVFASAARARRRHAGLLRAAGAQRGQVLGALLAEAVLLGLAGSGLGLLAGLILARLGAGLALEHVDLPPVAPLPAGWTLVSLALGVLTSLAGALAPAIRAARQPPLAALQIDPMPLRSARPGGAWETLSRLWAPMAAANLAREPGRAWLIAGSLAVILGMLLGSVGVLALLNEQLAGAFNRLAGADYLVLPGLTTLSLRELAGQDTSDVPPLSPGLLAALHGLESQARLMAGTTADVEALQVFPGQPTLLLDVESYAHMGGFRFEAGDWPGALEAFHRGPAVLLTPVVARRLGVGPGDRVRLPTRHGPVDFSVAGVGDSEFTTCILDVADGAKYFGANEINGVAVQIRPGVDAEAVRRALLDAVHTHGGTLLSLDQAAAQVRQVFRRVQVAMGALVGVTGLVAGLGVVNAMLASVAERRREIGLLRAVGATRSQVGRLILAEAAALGALAALAGTAIGWGATLLFVALARAYLPGLALAGPPDAPSGWLSLAVASLAGLLLWPLLAMLGALAPAMRAARLPVILAVGEAAPE
jgi:putative ABC transport system permease protein